jgi:hypothetical protein
MPVRRQDRFFSSSPLPVAQSAQHLCFLHKAPNVARISQKALVQYLDCDLSRCIGWAALGHRGTAGGRAQLCQEDRCGAALSNEPKAFRIDCKVVEHHRQLVARLFSDPAGEASARLGVHFGPRSFTNSDTAPSLPYRLEELTTAQQAQKQTVPGTLHNKQEGLAAHLKLHHQNGVKAC